MNKWFRGLTAILVLILALYFLIFYINHTFIPVKLKSWLIKTISEYTRQEVEIKSLQFGITKGFILTGVKIYEGPPENKKFLFKSDRLSFTLIFLPSFKKYGLIIPRINLYEPYLSLERFTDGTWNVSSLLEKPAENEKPSRFYFAVKGISFDNAEISFADYYESKGFRKTITALKGSVGLSLPDSLSLSCTGTVDKTPVKIASRYRPSKKEAFINLDIENLELTEYWNEYVAADTGQAGIPKIASGICGGSLRLNISNFETIDAKADISIQNLKTTVKDVGISGDYKLEGASTFNIKEPSSLRYDLKLELDKASAATSLKSVGTIDDIKGTLYLSEKRWSSEKLSCLLYKSPSIIRGEIRNPHKDFVADIDLQLTLSLKEIADIAGIDFESGQAKLSTKLTYKKDGTYLVDGTSKIGNLKFRQKDIIISGDFSITGESAGMAGNWETLSYKGNVNFDKVTIEGAGLLPFISDASGDAAFDTKHLTIKNLTGTAADTKVIIKGDIDYKEKLPLINMSLKADNLSLAKLMATLPEESKVNLKDIDVKGSCSFNVDFAGTAGSPDTYKYNGRILLKDSSASLPYWPYGISNISCDMRFEKEKVEWRNFTCDIKGATYHCDGTIINLAQPEISTDIKSDNLDIAAKVKIGADKVINISKLSGKYYNSTFSIAGKIKDTGTLNSNIAGDIYLDLKDLAYVFTAYGDTLRNLKPGGTVKISFDIKGPLKKFTDCMMSAEGTTDAIYIGNLRFDDFSFEYSMKDRLIDIPVIAAYPYGGIINISSRINLKTEDRPYIINIDIKDIELHELVKDTEFKDKKIKGKFAGKTALNGYLNKKGSLQGIGWLQVSDGYLWEFPVMRGIMDLILMVPPEYLALTDAFGNFSVHNSRIYTEDFKILSKVASLLWVGSLGFDGTLDFNITGRFAEDVIKQTTEPGRIANAILREAGNLIMEVKLAGTLKNPKYQLVPFPMKKILKEEVVDRLKEIFGNILE